ncbi:protein adenylyltransferase SelO family protein [Sphingomonas hengshuiensis]|uniref:Protein nucleotidyltransferase YdiU n=1 Tax=Sphingomonas hengshuiensis TaxID=1609977 RepID=A0A7U4J7Y9_9SPHN|nr:YdiU family protein [Sphingomonas hengshuiensis]AJP71925.1 selenoprotein O [Sphingomonas hengshuiensis]
MAFTPQQAILELGDGFSDPVHPARFPQTILRFRNDLAAAQVGLDGLSDAEWIAHFGRFEPLPGSLPQPLALRYHGHQFRVYNPEIGDGRGFLFAQMTDDRGRLMDLGTKGSGQTPYSRFGDGRLTLKGGVREILATEMLEALGVETSRTFSLIETGEELHRGDEPSPTRSAVMVRLNHGHIRIGTFQRLAHFQDTERLAVLTDYVLRHYYGETPGEDAPARLLSLVAGRTARLAGQFMAAGFVHGVLNSDNINVSGESFDYGPWRFAPTWDPRFTAAYFDQSGLYAFGRQPEAIYWDVMQFASSLRLIAEEEPLVAALGGFADAFRAEMASAMLWRLGLVPFGDARDAALVQAVEQVLATTGAPLDRFYFDAFGGALPARYGEPFAALRDQLASFAPRKPRDHPYWSDAEPCAMLIDEVEAIWAPIAAEDDWSLLERKVAAIRRMGAALA